MTHLFKTGFHPGTSLGGLIFPRQAKRRRISSYDKSGGNADYWLIESGECRTIADLSGSGIIRHIWMTIGTDEPFYPRRIVLRMFWDDEPSPSVEAPIGDFFGIGHGLLKNFWSLPLSMSPEDGRGMNCYFPMPFFRRAKIEVDNQGNKQILFYFYIDYEEHRALPEDVLFFHAFWNRENPTEGWGEGRCRVPEVWKTPNLDGAGNYLILHAEGRGHYVGCNLNVDCFQRQKIDWYGEGDDMIFIDGDVWPPTLHGTGTEDYFNMAFCPKQEFCTPYHGLTLYSGTPEWPWKGKNSMFRFHIEDPVFFERSIRVTIEHGHANNLSHDYSSTAYWYQTEPHRPQRPLPPVPERLPRRS